VNCSEAQERLSQFYDNGLSQDEAARVSAHVADCSSCASELASFQRLSKLSHQLTDPPVPPRMWEQLESKIGLSEKGDSFLAGVRPHQRASRFFVLAASVLVATGIGTIAYQIWNSAEHHHFAMNFSDYLEEFSDRPEDAQQLLLAKYEGRPTTLQEATNTLGYKPAAAQGLPPGYSVEKVYMLKMPCCTCAQVICKNKAGHSVAIFEHEIAQPVWFGERPTVECTCHNKPTSTTQVGDQLAATWKQGKRHITIIGASDLGEVTEFVAYFKGFNAG